MSTLIVLLPEQPRLLAAQAQAGVTAPAAALSYVLTGDGTHLAQRGDGPPSAWPKADSVVAVLPAADVAWHVLTVPKAPAPKLRAAVLSLLEDALLEDEGDLHLALPPQLKVGEEAFVAVMNRSWLKGQIEAIEATGLTVDKVVPAWAPDGPAAAHVAARAGVPWLHWRDDAGVMHLPLDSGAARWWLARQPADLALSWTASPDCAAAAGHWAGDQLAALSADQSLLAAAQSPWNLRQFDLSTRHRGSRLASEGWRQFRTDPSWRWVRWGLLGLVAVQLLGGRLWAWQQDRAYAAQKQERIQVLQASFPHVKAIQDPLLQMQKEVELARTAAGRPGEGDLEPLLQATDTAWPPSRGPADNLLFEPGKLTVVSAGWSPQEVEGLRERLRPLGYQLDDVPGRLTITPARLKPGSPAPTLAAPPVAPSLSAKPMNAAPPAANVPGAPPAAAPIFGGGQRPPVPTAAPPEAQALTPLDGNPPPAPQGVGVPRAAQ